MPSKRVLICGAGPVGMVTAVGLCRAGIPVTVLEAGPTVCQDLRASYYHAPTVDMLEDIGFLEPLLRGGTRDSQARFTDVALGEQVVLDFSILRRRYRNPCAVSAGQNWFTQVGYELLRDLDCEVLFNHKVLGAKQSDDEVTVSVDTPQGVRDFNSEWVIGCDGGRSALRKSLDIEFEGFSWQDRFLLIHTRFDFEPQFGRLDYRANGPDWRLVIRIPYGPGKNDWIYRVVSGIKENEDAEAFMQPAACEARLQALLKKDSPYDIEGATVYNVHQRVAKKYRQGRIVLVGDAAHLNNPIGGQGLNCGIHDAFNLCEKFPLVWRGKAEHTLLDLYDRQRRLTNWEYIQKISIENKKRNEDVDMDSRRRSIEQLKSAMASEESQFKFLERWSMGASLDYAKSIT